MYSTAFPDPHTRHKTRPTLPITHTFQARQTCTCHDQNSTSHGWGRSTLEFMGIYPEDIPPPPSHLPQTHSPGNLRLHYGTELRRPQSDASRGSAARTSALHKRRLVFARWHGFRELRPLGEGGGLARGVEEAEVQREAVWGHGMSVCHMRGPKTRTAISR